MVNLPGTATVAAPGPPGFALHTLGWRAFQDLCAAVLRQVWGQSVQAFADSNDAGRDGAFYGVWHDSDNTSGLRDLPAGPFVLQCKHTKNPGATLAPSELEDEFAKVEALVRQGLCYSYVLLTNARVSGASEATIKARLVQCGVVQPLILGNQWLCDTIATHQNLRLFVPRVYGLGDLSTILDERAYAQTSTLIAASRDQIATFVVTEAYRRAAQALQDHRFVLLLGEPAVGKSVIALMLAIASADNWGCLTIKARTATELVDRWNPHEPEQFFWVDDAFGAVRHEEQLTHDWSRNLPQVMAALQQGARIVLTSRNYIYEDARSLLRDYAYPRLREQQVTVDVADISAEERRQILYNHVAGGDQPADVRRQMKPFLERAADVDPFRPECARRLGQHAFTKDLPLTGHGIEQFMASPHQFLRDIYAQLGPDEQAALALVYTAARGGILASPVALNVAQCDIITRAGGTPAGASKALQSLTGTFLQRTVAPISRPGWSFRHPTLWEGFASWISTQSHLLSVVLSGLDDNSLLNRTDCRDPEEQDRRGVLLRVPSDLYPDVAARLAAIRLRPKAPVESWRARREWSRAVFSYLARNSSDSFLRAYLSVDPDLVTALMSFTSYVSAVAEPRVLARLHQARLLTETQRQQTIERLTWLAMRTPDATWLDRPEWGVLLSSRERTTLMNTIRDELVPRLSAVVDEWLAAEPGDDDDPVEHSLAAFARAFEALDDFDSAAAFDEARETYSELRERKPANEPEDSGLGWQRRHPRPADGGQERSIFDDIDE